MDTYKVFKGSTFNLSVEITDDDNLAVDLVGGTLRLIIKVNKDDPDVDAIVDESITSFDDPASGIQVIQVDAATTATMDEGYYFGQIKFTSNDSSITFDDTFGVRIKKTTYAD